VLEAVVNFREGEVVGKPTDIRLGKVRYSSTQRFQSEADDVPVFVSPRDFLGKRTALFGMTRTGKSNTVKKIIQASVLMSGKAPRRLDRSADESAGEKLDPFSPDGAPKYPVGQIIFDVNGEYANANLQDEGTAVFELYADQVTRYSVLEKPGFKVMKVNFYRDVLSGFELVRSHLALEAADYARSFLSADLSEPADKADFSATTRHGRKKAAYLCCLSKAGFKPPPGFTVKFPGEKEINAMVRDNGGLDPGKGVPLAEACDWFAAVWDKYEEQFFVDYKRKKGREWADEDLKAMLVFLSRKTKPGGNANVSGYLKLRSLAGLHTETVGMPFEEEIIDELRQGRIVIVDLSQGDPEIQRLYSERICRYVFSDGMARFTGNRPNNFVQFYFEEAHNLFPRKDDRDLSQVYNRIAKEGAKLNLGLIYATQEVSSISANILKNTQNWFIPHLNNEDETREVRKYYDFGDFTDALVRFSASDDKGFVRMKTYSNPFVVPVQVDRFAKGQ
jgi:DNA helicase HerA-like ATPase